MCDVIGAVAHVHNYCDGIIIRPHRRGTNDNEGFQGVGTSATQGRLSTSVVLPQAVCETTTSRTQRSAALPSQDPSVLVRSFPRMSQTLRMPLLQPTTYEGHHQGASGISHLTWTKLLTPQEVVQIKGVDSQHRASHGCESHVVVSNGYSLHSGDHLHLKELAPFGSVTSTALANNSASSVCLCLFLLASLCELASAS